MARILIAVGACVVVAGFVTFAVVRARRRRQSQIPELNKHPERLEQMLDETDDA
jgi:hypothetical protein